MAVSRMDCKDYRSLGEGHRGVGKKKTGREHYDPCGGIAWTPFPTRGCPCGNNLVLKWEANTIKCLSNVHTIFKFSQGVSTIQSGCSHHHKIFHHVKLVQVACGYSMRRGTSANTGDLHPSLGVASLLGHGINDPPHADHTACT